MGHVCLSELACILQEAIPCVVLALVPIETRCDIWR